MNQNLLVTKRDGSTERINLDKIHRVLDWAAEGLHNVSISQVELRSHIQFYDGIKTSDIHETIIKAAADLISRDAPDYQYLAARLAIFHLRKKAYGQFEPPALYDHVVKMVEMGTGLEGVAEELYHCGFEGMNITFTSDIKEALTDAKYIVNSGGAARKAGMTREDLLKGNAAIAEEFGKNVKAYCPDVKHIVVIFNPADITGLITLLYSGLKPSQVTTLAALDSTRLRSELSKHFGIAMDNVENCRTYGGHGEQMAVYASTAKVNGKALLDIIGTDALTKEQWTEIQQKVTKGGANIINLRGRSSFQSPSYVSIEMIAAAMGGKPFRWPAGTYVSNGKFDHIMMAWETSITKDGCHLKEVKGTPEEEAALEKSYAHLCALRDEVIAMGVLPPVSEWNKLNPYIK